MKKVDKQNMYYTIKENTIGNFNDPDNIAIFTNIYENKFWGDHGNNSDLYSGSSGVGSTIENNINIYIPFIKTFITENNIQSVVDIGCGDWQNSHLIYDTLHIKYTGYDAYEKVINANKIKYPNYTFIHIDAVKQCDKLENADLCIIKDVLMHLYTSQINTLLTHIINNKKYKYILLINTTGQTIDNTEPNGDAHFRPLNIEYNPLKQYNPTSLLNYSNDTNIDPKNISVIKL